MDELVSMLAGDEPTAQEALAALSQKLRRQQAVGTLASLIGGPAKDFGQTLTRQAEQGLQQVAEAPGQRLRMALGRQQLATGNQEMQAQAATAQRAARPVGKAMQLLMGKMAPILTPETTAGMTETDAEKIFPALSAYSAKEDAARARALTAKTLAAQSPANNMDEDTLNMLADQAYQMGKVPSFGYGKDAAALRLKVLARIPVRHPGANLAAMAADYGANAASQKKLQTQADTVGAFESTAMANLRLAGEAIKSVANVGSPFFNRPLREISDRLSGSPQQAAFNAARQAAVGEVSKVISGQTGGGVVSDSARHEMEQLLSPDATPAQFFAVMQLLEQDMANRTKGFDTGLGNIRGRMSGGAVAPPSQDEHAQALQWAKDHPGPEADALLADMKRSGVIP